MATRKLLPLPFDVVSDGTDNSNPLECTIMTNSADSGICQDYEQPEDEANALSIVVSLGEPVSVELKKCLPAFKV